MMGDEAVSFKCRYCSDAFRDEHRRISHQGKCATRRKRKADEEVERAAAAARRRREADDAAAVVHGNDGAPPEGAAAGALAGFPVGGTPRQLHLVLHAPPSAALPSWHVGVPRCVDDAGLLRLIIVLLCRRP
jgi:hypothetical protein